MKSIAGNAVEEHAMLSVAIVYLACTGVMLELFHHALADDAAS